MIKGIVFDKDGTLFDFRKTWEAWASALIQRVAGGDMPTARKIGACIGFDFDSQSFERDSVVIAGTPGEIAVALAPVLPEYPNLIDILNEEAAVAPQAEAVPLDPLLGSLRTRGLRLGVATNDGIDPAVAHLEAAGIVHHFDFVAGYDSGFGGKPAPGQLLGFCQHTGLQPDAVLMVGDSMHDLMAGKAAKMRTVGVTTGMATRSDLEPHADVVLPNIGHLPVWLDSQN